MNDKENFLTSTPVVDRSSNDRPVNRESPITSRSTRASRRIDFSSSQISINGTIDNTDQNEESKNETKCPVCNKTFLYTSQFKNHLVKFKNCKIGYRHLKDSAKQKNPEVQYICQDCGKSFSAERNFLHHTRYRCPPIPQYDGTNSIASQVNNDDNVTAITAESSTVNHIVSLSAESIETAITAESETLSQIGSQTSESTRLTETESTRLTETGNLLVSSQRPFLDNDNPDSSSSSSSDSEEDIQQVYMLIRGLCIRF